MKKESTRASREIAHGSLLAEGDAEAIWGWNSPAGRRRARRRADMIIEKAHLREGVKALEIGCGTGSFTEMFAASGAGLTAVDISAELLALARKRDLPPDRVTFVEGTFEESPFGTLFDAVIGSSVLHHLDVLPSLEKIHALLKPGGRMCFAEPNMLNPQVFLVKNIPWLKRMMGDTPDETAFFPWRIRDLCVQAGFRGVRVVPFDWLHPATPPALIGTVSRVGALAEGTPLLQHFAGSLCLWGEKG